MVLGFFKSPLSSYKTGTQLAIQVLCPSGIVVAQHVHPMIQILLFPSLPSQFCTESEQVCGQEAPFCSSTGGTPRDKNC